MKNLMLFEEFTPNPKNNVLAKILNRIQPDIDSLLEKYRKSFEKQLEKPMTKYDEELARLTIIFDLVKSIGNHTKPDDDLKEIRTSVSPKGNLEIDAIIVRDGVEYPLSTEVIYAGGYNIQRLHYRYITKTRLPKSSSNELADAYNKKIKSMTAIEKIRNEIESYEKRILNNDTRVGSSKKLSDEEILDLVKQKDNYFDWPTWDEIVSRGADKNYDYSEEKYNKSKEEGIARDIDFWKSQNIEWPEKNSVALKKEVEKLKKKLAVIEQ
jgi:hypothetical protein